MEFIRRKRLLALIGIIALILGTMLPYLVLSSFFGGSQSISLWVYWQGKVIVALTIVNALFIFNDYIEKYIPQLSTTSIGKKIANVKNPKVSLIPTILVAGLVIYFDTPFNFSSKYLDHGIGFYLLWVGIICLVIHAFIYKKIDEGNVNQADNNENVSPQQNYQQVAEPQMQQSFQNSGVSKKFCPNCGNQVDETATECFRCGNKF